MNTRTRARGRLVLAVAVLMAVGPIGCGRLTGDDSPVVANSAPPPTAAAEPAGEPTPAAPPATEVDACKLITDEEAEKLAGTPLEAPVPVGETCTWTGPVTGPTAQVEIFVGDGAKKYLDIERELDHEIWPLSGIGDEAYAEDGAVFLNKGGLWVAIRLTLLNDPKENRGPLENLARTVAGRL